MSISIVFAIKAVGERIIKARKKLGYSQQDLAKVVKVHFALMNMSQSIGLLN